MLEARPPPVPGLPQLPRPPSQHAVLNTPVDWIRCTYWFLPCPCSLPRFIGGSAYTTILSRPAQALLTLRPAKLLAHHAWALSRGFIAVVSQLQCSLATRPNQHLSGRVLPPLVICAIGAHYEIRSSRLRKNSIEVGVEPENSLVSTTQPDKKKVYVEKTTCSWMCLTT